ncbi:hypothetical protein FCOIX_5640 [Fusarium coicis]|nr:hypothetical protein FCOIX_5640 [Fusarium coicis]
MREDSEIFPVRKPSWDSLSSSSYSSIANGSSDIDTKAELHICTLSYLTLVSRQQLEPMLSDDITGTVVNDCQSLQHRVYNWLSTLPDIPWLDMTYVCPTYEDPVMTEDFEENELASTEVNNFPYHLDSLHDSNQAEVLEMEEYSGVMERELKAYEDESNSLLDVSEIRGAYHEALLQINLASTPNERLTGPFRPSIRRHYP